MKSLNYKNFYNHRSGLIGLCTLLAFALSYGCAGGADTASNTDDSSLSNGTGDDPVEIVEPQPMALLAMDNLNEVNKLVREAMAQSDYSELNSGSVANDGGAASAFTNAIVNAPANVVNEMTDLIEQVLDLEFALFRANKNGEPGFFAKNRDQVGRVGEGQQWIGRLSDEKANTVGNTQFGDGQNDCTEADRLAGTDGCVCNTTKPEYFAFINNGTKTAKHQYVLDLYICVGVVNNVNQYENYMKLEWSRDPKDVPPAASDDSEVDITYSPVIRDVNNDVIGHEFLKLHYTTKNDVYSLFFGDNAGDVNVPEATKILLDLDPVVGQTDVVATVDGKSVILRNGTINGVVSWLPSSVNISETFAPRYYYTDGDCFTEGANSVCVNDYEAFRARFGPDPSAVTGNAQANGQLPLKFVQQTAFAPYEDIYNVMAEAHRYDYGPSLFNQYGYFPRMMRFVVDIARKDEFNTSCATWGTYLQGLINTLDDSDFDDKHRDAL